MKQLPSFGGHGYDSQLFVGCRKDSSHRIGPTESGHTQGENSARAFRHWVLNPGALELEALGEGAGRRGRLGWWNGVSAFQSRAGNQRESNTQHLGLADRWMMPGSMPQQHQQHPNPLASPPGLAL